LTPRERELVRAVVDGLNNEQIAARLGIQEQTVRNHLSVVYHKAGVSSRLELALAAIRQGFLDN
jgi:DNA-binding NarL/FixJ family response regulator